MMARDPFVGVKRLAAWDRPVGEDLDRQRRRADPHRKATRKLPAREVQRAERAREGEQPAPSGRTVTVPASVAEAVVALAELRARTATRSPAEAEGGGPAA